MVIRRHMTGVLGLGLRLAHPQPELEIRLSAKSCTGLRGRTHERVSRLIELGLPAEPCRQ